LARAAGRRRRPWFVEWFALAVGGLVLAYAALVEPYRLEVTRYDVPAAIAAPLKIAQLSDLHARRVGRLERRILAALDRERPDIIVVTGDFVASVVVAPGLRGISDAEIHLGSLDVLRRLRAPLGVYLVRGNWEFQRPLPGARRLYEQAGLLLLENEHVRLHNGVYLVGLDDPSYGHADVRKASAGIPADAFVVALYHSPEYFDAIPGRFDLTLAGHTHGGQVRIPFVRPFWVPGGSGRFVAGWYRNGEASLYVSRGLGTTSLPIRFLCRPELAILTLTPAGP
jgi:hypothetical protein